MKLEEYIEHRRRIEQHQDSCLNSLREICLLCRRPVSACLCQFIRPIVTQTRIILLMHPMEARKIKNGTGRLTHLCLNNSELITGIDFSLNRVLNSDLTSREYSPIILYPGPGSRELTGDELRRINPEGNPFLAVFIDGTWRTAKKMMKLSRNLHSLPRFSLHPPNPSSFVIKKQPRRECLSTIESVYYLLNTLRDTGIEPLDGEHNNLMDVFRRLVSFQLECTSDSRRSGYRRRNGTDISGKSGQFRPQGRNPFFDSRD